MDKCICIGNLINGVYANMHDISRRVYDTEGIAPTIHTVGGGNLEPKIAEPIIAAMRGRNPDNPNSRESGLPTQQRLEIKGDGISNTLTTVQKDNLVIEPAAGQFQPKDRDYNKKSGIREERFEVRNDYVSNSVLTHDKKNCVVESPFRVRKLTPKECWRLMGFTDEDFDRAKAALNKTFYKGKDRSNSQLYKQAGNSIVVNVLMAIFETMR